MWEGEVNEIEGSMFLEKYLKSYPIFSDLKLQHYGLLFSGTDKRFHIFSSGYRLNGEAYS